MLERYAAFSENCSRMQLRPGETANDAWFAEQRDAFERGEENWLEHEESGTAVAAAMRNLRGAWLSNAREYVGAAVGPDAADEFFADGSAIRLFVWAAAHHGCSLHTPHVHQVGGIHARYTRDVREMQGCSLLAPHVHQYYLRTTPYALRPTPNPNHTPTPYRLPPTPIRRARSRACST